MWSGCTAVHTVQQSAHAIMLPSMRLRLRAACAATATVLLAAAAASGADLVQEFIRRHWSQPLAPQGPPPARFSPLEASLHPESCGTCHPAPHAGLPEGRVLQELPSVHARRLRAQRQAAPEHL